MKNTLLVLFICLFNVIASYSQTIARISVQAGTYSRMNTPVCLDITNLTFINDSDLCLTETTGKAKIPVSCQFEEGRQRLMWWILSGKTESGSVRTFELKKGKGTTAATGISSALQDGALVLSKENRNILQYNYATKYPPAGVDSAYRRSGFIHPLWSPSGNVLTNIQPADHYHHYGIWHPWTKTSFEGEHIDFWNLKMRLGTIRYDGFIANMQGAVFTGFKAHQVHVVHPDTLTAKKALNEILDVRVYNIDDRYRLIDYTITQSCATSSPLTVEEYRYQGFGFRANADWTKENAQYLTSEGKTRKDADNTRARWCIVSGESTYGRSGIIFMSNPANYNSPEPIRIWDETQNNGRGDVFFNFCPAKTTSWKMIPGKEYTLKYRMLVFDDETAKETAEQAYVDFAYPPVITIEKLK